MYENMINNVVNWERRLDFENEQRKAHRISIAMEDSMAPGPCRIEYKTIFTWNYKFEKDYQPLFSGSSQDCIAVLQPC
ncbi:MAG: hypothetical protein CVU43_15395 [Chloroflexi bacterium HGW-Chloroflexi-5]|jgi:hypothetical protein|nr:MAG: hypothetical protein CVU43_15395 [Chloroflexi bacterium HGW-Chloroflexi-5]